MKCTDIREVEMTEPQAAYVDEIDGYILLTLHDRNGSIFIRCKDLSLAEAAAAAINAAIGGKP